MGGENIVIFENLDTLIFNEFCFKKNMLNTLSKMIGKRGDLFRGGIYSGEGGFDHTLQKQGGIVPGGFDQFSVL